MSNLLEMNFLGTPEVLCNGREVTFATRKAMALVAYLVVEQGTHPREKLQAIFWPESETHLAQSALRNTLSRIKAGLQDVEGSLHVEAHSIGFNDSIAHMLDLDLVTQAAAVLPSPKNTPPIISLLQKAVEIWRGPFLEAFSLPDSRAFDDWTMMQRTAWGYRLNLIFDTLSISQLETHLIKPAIDTVNRWLVMDRLNETAHRRLMRLHFLNGERSAALQAYEICRSLLVQELGVEPSPETEEELSRIRSTSPPLPSHTPSTGTVPSLDIPFVGRSNEYQALIKLFYKVKNGTTQVVVVSGEQGIGKTRLTDEFLNWAALENADILRTRTYKTGVCLPYQPIIDALRKRLEIENAPEDLLDDAWLVELTTILPELRDRYPDLSVVPCDETTARSRLFEAIARLGQSLANRRPLVVLLDDLQWADSGTLELLQYLAQNWHSNRGSIMLILLVRTELPPPESGINDWIEDLDRVIPITQLSLGPLEVSDVQKKVQSLAGAESVSAADLHLHIQQLPGKLVTSDEV